LRKEEGERPIGPRTLVFIPGGEKHQLVAAPGSPLRFLEFQGPNRFKATILDGDQDDLRWFHEDGRLWEQT
jgi:mannose-6-phosphate isomerase-like protein (cupin superfamily)